MRIPVAVTISPSVSEWLPPMWHSRPISSSFCRKRTPSCTSKNKANDPHKNSGLETPEFRLARFLGPAREGFTVQVQPAFFILSLGHAEKGVSSTTTTNDGKTNTIECPEPDLFSRFS